MYVLTLIVLNQALIDGYSDYVRFPAVTNNSAMINLELYHIINLG